jgi:amino acid transporter
MVRAWNVFDGFIYALYADSIFVAAALTYGLSWPWPDGNIPLAIVLNCVLVYPAAIVYAMLASTMPRVGGDYVWESRTLGGFWGYTICLAGLGFWPWMYAVTNVLPGTVTAVSPTFLVIGGMTGNTGLVSFASWLTTAWGQWWAYVVYSAYAAIIMAAGMKWYARVQRASFFIGCAAVVVWVVMFLVTTQQDFISNFNWFMSTYFNYGGGNAYQYILNQSAALGYHPVAFANTTFLGSFELVPVMAYVFLYILWTGGMSGEIGGIADLKKSMWLYVGSNTFALVVCAGTMLATILIVGNQFFFASNYIWYNVPSGPAALPIAPFIGFLYVAMTRNPFFWIATLIGMNAWFWIWPTNNWVQSIRMIFAMSFDRSLPGWMGAVNRKTRTPLNAIILVTIGCLIMGWLYTFTVFYKFTLDVTFGSALAFFASTIAGTIMPYRKRTKAIWEASPASKYKIGNVPVITIAGILAIVFLWIPMYYLWVTDSRYGINDPLSGAVLIASFVAAGILYFVVKAYRKRQGVDIDLLYHEVPYE